MFKPLTLRAETRGWTWWQEVALYFRVIPVGLAASMTLVALAGGLAGLAGHAFDWITAFVSVLVAGFFGGLLVGLGVVLLRGRSYGLVVGLGVVLLGGLVSGPAGGLGEGLAFGLPFGLLGGLVRGLVAGLLLGLVGGLSGLLSGWLNGLLFGDRITAAVIVGFVSAYIPSFLVFFLRPFYLIPYAVQYQRAKQALDPFKIFRNSPVYWDEVIGIPLPKLTDWLVRLVRHDRKQGLKEILFVAEQRPYQRSAAQRALIAIAIEDLQRVWSLEGMARAAQLLEFLPAEAEHLPAGLSEARRRIDAIAALAQDFLTRKTGTGQSKILADLRPEIERFRDAMALVKPPVGTSFQPLASRWLAITEQAELECRRRSTFASLPNPFIVGNPLKPRDQDIFKGRRDIIIAIEENIINPAQRPALLLYGRRRIGKSSTLLHLPKLLSSQFVPVYIDCQDATQPVPMLEYQPGLVDAILKLTHCQPYLLQALASELVNHLNAERRLVATREDLDLAVDKVLVTAQAYFFYTWNDDCGEEEREVLRALATDEAGGYAPTYERTFLTLAQKEILERSDHRYVYTIELFRRWILKNQVPSGSSEHIVPATPGRFTCNDTHNYNHAVQ